MAFTLLEIASGTHRTFTLIDLLKLLGDRINDEIIFSGKTYRISSFQEQAPTVVDGTVDWETVEFTIPSPGTEQFHIEYNLTDTDALFLTVNNVLYQYGPSRDFHIEGITLHWHGPFALETSDRMVLRFPNTVTF